MISPDFVSGATGGGADGATLGEVGGDAGVSVSRGHLFVFRVVLLVVVFQIVEGVVAVVEVVVDGGG